ncbi:MAG: LEPR-XLL domain-containing protein, partial [Hellea sp.]|nr:LEPR-XLL domain-containing protein [Hellea sp.]
MAPFDGFGGSERDTEKDKFIEWSRSKHRTALSGSASRTAFIAGLSKKTPARVKGRPQRLEPIEPRILLSADSFLPVPITDELTGYDGDNDANVDKGLASLADKIRELIADGSEFEVEIPGLRANASDTSDPLVPMAKELFELNFDQIADPSGGGLVGALKLLQLSLADLNDDGKLDTQEGLIATFIEPLREFLDTFGDDTPAPDGQKYVPDDGDPPGGTDLDDLPDLAPITLSNLINGFTDLGPANGTGDDTVVQGLTSFLTMLTEPTGLSDWLDFSITNLDNLSAGTVISYELTLNLTFKSEYLLDLGLEADSLEIFLPEDVPIETLGIVTLPIAFAYDTATGDFSLIDRGGVGDFDPTTDQITFEVEIDRSFEGAGDIDVNIGFLGTDTTSESFFKLSIPYTAEMIDPSSPFNIGFEVDDFRLDGDGEISSDTGDLIAVGALDETFSTNIIFELKIGSEGADSPGVISINIDPADISDANDVVTEIQEDIDSAFGGSGGPLTVALDGGMLKFTLNDSVDLDATTFGFDNQENFDGANFLATSELTTDNAPVTDFVTDDFMFSGAFLLSVGGAQPVLIHANNINITGLDATERRT